MDTLDNPQVVDPKTVSPWPISMRYGVIAAVILIIFGLVMYLTGFSDPATSGKTSNWIGNIVNFGVMIGAAVMAVRKHRDEELGGFVSFGRAFTTSFLVNLVVTVISAIWVFAFFSYIAPEMLDAILEQSRTQMIEERGMSEEQVEESMGMMGWMFSPGFFAISAGFMMLLMGVIISLIIAAVMKKEAPQAPAL
jgi:hypothetical protein